MLVCTSADPPSAAKSHLGMPGHISLFVVYRYLVHLGYKVRYVRNITDAGHFEEEGREAEDKVSKRHSWKNWSLWSWCRNTATCSIGR